MSSRTFLKYSPTLQVNSKDVPLEYLQKLFTSKTISPSKSPPKLPDSDLRPQKKKGNNPYLDYL